MDAKNRDFRLIERMRWPELRTGLGLGIPVGGIGAPAATFDFLKGETLDSRITFTRGSTATRVNSSGLIESVASGAARFDYDPVTLAAKGLLLEGQRTNLIRGSADMANASYWTLNNGGSCVSGATAPDGTNTAVTLTDNVSGNFTYIVQTNVIANDGALYAASVYVGKTVGATSFPGFQLILSGGTGLNAGLALNTNTGVVTARTGETPAFLDVLDAGAYWRVCWGILNNTTGNTSLAITLVPAVNTNASATWAAATQGSAIFWGMQIEGGSFATSYIPTVGSQMTRAGDVATISGAGFSSFFNQAEGAILVDYDVNADAVRDSGNRVLFQISDGTPSERYLSYMPNGSPIAFVADGGVAQMELILTGTLLANTLCRFGLTYKVNDFYATRDGAAGLSSTSGTLPMVDRWSVGHTGGIAQLCGHVRKLLYYSCRLPNSKLQALTA